MDTKDRFALYYGTDKMITSLYNKSKNNQPLKNLWKKVLLDRNILYACKRISVSVGRNTPGPDGMTFEDIRKGKITDKKIINEVKKRLYGDIKPGSRVIHIPKKNNGKRKIGICNLYDKIAQQAIYNILEPILEAKYYDTNFGFRRRVGVKECFATIYNTVNNTQNGYIYDADIKNFFDKVQIKYALDSLRNNFKINDNIILKAIDRMMRIDSQYDEYSVGLVQGSVLGPVLANVLLHDLEVKINDLNDVNYHLMSGHKNPYQLIRKGSQKRYKDNPENLFKMEGSRRAIKIIRYADDFILYTNNPYDIYDGIMLVEDWLKDKGLELNKEKSKLIKLSGEFKFSFLGYRMRRTHDNKFIFSASDQTKVWKDCRKTLKRYRNNDSKIMSVFLSNFYTYDFVTNLNWYIKDIRDYMYRRTDGARKNNRISFEKTEGREIWTSTKSGMKDIKIDPWAWRSETKCSISSYGRYNFWDPNIAFHDGSEQTINSYIQDFINKDLDNNFKSYKIYLPGLIKRFKGKEPILHEPYTSINPNDLVVHHIRPRQYGGKTEFTNLVVLHKCSHDAITGYKKSKNKLKPGWSIDQKLVKRYRKKIDDYKYK